MRTSLDDAALRSAVMLTASFAAAGRLDRESLEHQSHTLRVLSARVQSADMAASEPTLAAMLLLAGIEDLNASTMTGSARIVDHDTFEELRWSRGATGFPSIFVLPEGFQEISHLLSDDLIEALKDIHAFQRIRDSDLFPTATVVSPMQIDNHQASIQSRLSGRPDHRTRESPLQECCRIAAYLCCAMLRCPMWRTSGAPAYLASQLLQCLQSCRSEPIWFHNPEIFAWLLYIGGAFSPSDSELRSEFVNDLCRSVVAPCAITRRSTSFCSWPETVRFLKRYIWSDKAYTSYVEHFWHDIKSFGKSSNDVIKHRIAMAPLTRSRATSDHIPTKLMKEYYGQRACAPGTLIISEGTAISAMHGGFPNGPGIWSEEQVAAWREITDEVHHRGSFIFCQLFAMGRAADAATATKEGFPILAPSPIPLRGREDVPRAMTTIEVRQTVQDIAAAARNAMRAGFDGVECHAANGYLLDQFLQDVSNTRTDEYGGSIENRSRLTVEVLEALIDAVGSADRVGLRLSPWSTFQDMHMADPIPQFSDILRKASRWPLAYLHLVESRISGAMDAVDKGHAASERLDFAYNIWRGPILVAGAYGLETARRLVEGEYPDKEIVVVFGRHFIANPDLVLRFKQGLKLNAYDRSTFYIPESPRGYVDYPFSDGYAELVQCDT
ncbi:hypothetical protein Micbo1qcDRAFT_153127 [Microdochium bolleyi]|uniref:NADH:flavin oxidoreductase/NADH oxidase N-terminal domain-containing protein n=1 Tax=Microdochium bolleyi TaxID=196109 RepID=A0A136IMU1_9PEZI|nr:hypothetical protein Micbo1qcDRAFT_153127 [Microdochium bolleyi]